MHKMQTYILHDENQQQAIITKENGELTFDIIDFRTPMYYLMKKDQFFNSLSKEALEVAKIVFEAPKDFLTSFRLHRPDRKKDPTKNQIRMTLRKKGWSHRKITKIFEELKHYVNNL